MKLPLKITPCPLIDAIVEFRFLPKVDPNAIFGIIYNSLRDKYNRVEKLSIIELPESIRETDPGLQFKPYYRLFNKNIVVQVGPRVLTVSSYPVYVGWETLLKEIKYVFGKLKVLDIVDVPNRIGLRYINFFEHNILEKINLEIIHIKKKIESNPISLRVEFKQNSTNQTLQISNSAKYNFDGVRLGSTIDVDVYRDSEISDFLNDMDSSLEMIHNQEKKLFFSLLKNDYLKTLKPEY